MLNVSKICIHPIYWYWKKTVHLSIIKYSYTNQKQNASYKPILVEAHLEQSGHKAKIHYITRTLKCKDGKQAVKKWLQWKMHLVILQVIWFATLFYILKWIYVSATTVAFYHEEFWKNDSNVIRTSVIGIKIMNALNLHKNNKSDLKAVN